MKRRSFLKSTSIAAAAALLGLPMSQIVSAQERSGTLRVLVEGLPNILDANATGTNSFTHSTTWNVYDRLIAFDRIPAEDGTFQYDFANYRGELLESFEVSEDNSSLTLTLKPGLTFHDGSPITSADVKWSLDRHTQMPAVSGFYALGNMTSPDQFVIVDDLTVRMDLGTVNRKTLPLLAFVWSAVYNSKLAIEHSTAEDPWATEWLKSNTAAGGAFRITNFVPGEQLVLERFEQWQGTTTPGYDRVIMQLSPEASNRVTAIIRGSADIVTNVTPKDGVALEADAALNPLMMPSLDQFHLLAMNSDIAPFNDLRVRQAVAHALPYEDLFQAVVFGRGKQLSGRAEIADDEPHWPPSSRYTTDLDRAKALMVEAGHADGFSTTMTFNIADAIYGEPLSILVQEALAKIGITVEINRVPASQYGQMMDDKQVPLFFERSSSLLRFPDYAYHIFFSQEWRWNFGSLRSEEMDQLIADAAVEIDPAKYDVMARRMAEIAAEQVPVIMLWQPPIGMVTRQEVEGYTYAMHQGPDFRTFTHA